MQKKNISLKNPYWSKGFSYEGETKCLVQKNYVRFELNEDDWTNLDKVTSLVKGNFEDDRAYSLSGRYIGRYESDNLDRNTDDNSLKIIHTIDDGEALKYCRYGDLQETTGGNLLYNSARYLGKAVFGENGNNGNTNKVVDEDERDLTTLGAKVGDTVLNIEDGSTATITSFSETNEPNDTANFTAGWSDSGSIEGDENFIIFNDTFKDFGVESQNEQFTGQGEAYKWSRQIEFFQNKYYILNGMYISTLDSDETTFTQQAIKLYDFHHSVDMAQNQQNLLIGANYQEKGVLFLWKNGIASDEFLSVVNLTEKIYSVKRYQSGWLVYAGVSIYYTNGYTVEKITQLRDTDELSTSIIDPQGMYIKGNKVILNIYNDYMTRNITGIHIYDLTSGSWEFTPFKNEEGGEEIEGAERGSIFSIEDYIYVSYKENYNHALGILRLRDVPMKSETMYYIKGNKNEVKGLELTLGVAKKNANSDYNFNAKITAGFIDSSRILFDSFEASSNGGINGINVDTSKGYNYVEVGDLVRALNKEIGGEISFITDVHAGSVSVSPDFSSITKDDCVFMQYPIKKLGQVEISGSRNINNPIRFQNRVEVKGDFYIYIHIESDKSSLEIRNITLC